MTETCENCAESLGMVDAEFVWCKVEGVHGGIVAKSFSCWRFHKGAKDEPITVDPWLANNTD